MEKEVRPKTVREEFADKFIALLKSEKPLEWTKGWSTGISSPYNGMSHQSYHGINRLVLMFAAAEKGWSDPRFYSFQQAKQLSLSVKSGEKATRVEFWMAWDCVNKKSMTIQEMELLLKSNKTRSQSEFSLFPKSYYVFNAAQIHGLAPLETKKADFDENILADRVIDAYCTNTGVTIRHGGDQAYYKTSEDYVQMPYKDTFISAEEYYGTVLHELCHSTGHPNRLNRPLSSVVADYDSYAIEELRAEIASTFVCGDIGITMSGAVMDNHLAYVQNWLSQIEQDHNVLFGAIKDAEKAADYVLDKGRVAIQKEKLETYTNEPKGISGLKYEIWQLSDAEYNRPIAFVGYDEASQYSLTQSRYDKKWEGIASENESTLEDIFFKFNTSLPEGYTGRSMSVSDVVVLDDGNAKRAFYCDNVGFREFTGFIKEATLQNVKVLTA